MSSYELSSLNINPASYFRFAVREAQSRAKLCEQYASVLDEIAANEEAFGKNIVKISSANRIRTADEWPAETNQMWNQICSAKGRLGKQHIGFSVCISQSISRELHDNGRSSSRSIQEIENKTKEMLDSLAKSSRQHKKKYGKYIRLIQDAETSIAARDAAIRDYAEKINDKPDDARFGSFNRSITKVLGKFAPTDALRKQHDRCRNLILELESTERDLEAATCETIARQKEYREQMKDAVHQIDNIEHTRLELLKNSLLRFCQATVGMNEHVREILMNLMSSASALDIQADVEVLEREINELRTPAAGSDDRNESATDCAVVAVAGSVGQTEERVVSVAPLSPSRSVSSSSEDDALNALRSNMLMLDRLKRALECIRAATQRATSTFVDLGDIEKLFGEVIVRGLEKYGYSLQFSSGSYSLSAATRMSGFVPNEPKCSDLVDVYESPSARQGWCGVVELADRLAESHATVAAVLLEKCSISSDSTVRRLDATLKEVSDKLTDVSKRVETARAVQSKLSSKLSRVRKELKDRRQASSNGSSKHSLHRHDNGGVLEGNALERESFDGDVVPAKAGRSGSVSSIGDGADGYHAQPSFVEKDKIERIERRKSEIVIHGLESLGTAFGAAAVNALGAASGVLESSTERNISRIATLEEEEKAYLDSLVTASAATSAVAQACLTDLSETLETLKGELASEMEALKASCMLMLDSSMMGLNISTDAVERLQKLAENVEVASDLDRFRRVVQDTSPSSVEEERKIQLSVDAFESNIDEFSKIENEIVDIERQNEKEIGDDLEATAPSTSLYAAAPTVSIGARGRGLISATKSRRSRSVGDDRADDVTAPRELASPSEESAGTNQRYSEGSDVLGALPVFPLKTGSPTGKDGQEGKEEEEEVLGRLVATVETQPSGESGCTEEDRGIDSHLSLSASPLQDTSEHFSPIKSTRDDVANHLEVIGERALSPPPEGPDRVRVTNESVFGQEASTENNLVAKSTERTIPRSGNLMGDSVTPKGSPSRNVQTVPTPSPSQSRGDSQKETSHVKSPVLIKAISGTLSPVPRDTSHLTSPELAKFDLPNDEKILEYFSCAIYPKRGLLTHGRMFITNHHVAFSGWPELRILISLKDIDNVEKKQMFFLPNALTIQGRNGDEYFFGSFLDRDLCFRMITSLVMIEKSLVELTEESSDTDPLSQSGVNAGPGERLNESKTHQDTALSSDSTEDDDDSRSPIDYFKNFEKATVATVYNDIIDISSSEAWNRCWKSKSHFESFLQSEGDFDIKATDWVPFTETLSKSQNPCGFRFQYCRTFEYLHPRTSMLMFGPKNATAKQTQYLYIPSMDGEVNPDAGDLRKVGSGVILTASQFEGIPMCDVFEVLMYWSFRAVSSEGGNIGNKTCLVVGCAVNYLKSTMLKGQIFAGVKEELELLSKNWVSHAMSSCSAGPSAGNSVDRSQTEIVVSVDETSSGALSSESSRQSTDTTRGGASTVVEGERLRSPTFQYPTDQKIIFFLFLVVMIVQLVLIFAMYLHITKTDARVAEILNILAESLQHGKNIREQCGNRE